MKTLYLIATPIGNLAEVSPYARLLLSQKHYFFCENATKTKQLLSLLNISVNKRFILVNAYNEQKVIAHFDFNQSDEYVLVTSAGYPLISDPGYLLVQKFIKHKWCLQVAHGPCAYLHALLVAGFSLQQVLLCGFLAHKMNAKQQQLAQLSCEYKTLVVFESAHRLAQTLALLPTYFPSKTPLCLLRELSKKHETIYRCYVGNLPADIVYKGEFVIVLDHNQGQQVLDWTRYCYEIKRLVQKGYKSKSATKMVAYKYNLKANALYAFCFHHKKTIES